MMIITMYFSSKRLVILPGLSERKNYKNNHCVCTESQNINQTHSRKNFLTFPFKTVQDRLNAARIYNLQSHSAYYHCVMSVYLKCFCSTTNHCKDLSNQYFSSLLVVQSVTVHTECSLFNSMNND